MSLSSHAEHGQSVVEFAIIAMVLIMATAGLLDVGRMFFQYNALAAAARYGARWGGVVGSTCSPSTHSGAGTGTNDWCTQLGQTTTAFWSQSGNRPVWGDQTTTCPSDLSGTNATNSYVASSYTGSTSTTIVGAIVQKFDSSNTSTNFITGSTTPGLDPSKLKVCIQLSPDAWRGGIWNPLSGDIVTVYLYYPFNPVSTLISSLSQINLEASASYVME